MENNDIVRAALLLALVHSVTPALKAASVHVVARTGFGTVLQSAVVDHFLSAQSVDLAERFKQCNADHIPVGNYLLSVSVDGFRTSKQEVVVTAADIWVTAVLDLDSIDLQSKISLSGRLERLGRSHMQGTRAILVGVFWNFRAEVVMTSEERFAFADLKAGKYLLIITDGSGISKIQPVDVRALNDPLKIEI